MQEVAKSWYVITKRVKIAAPNGSGMLSFPEQATTELPCKLLLSDREVFLIEQQTEVYTPIQAADAGLVPVERYHGGHVEAHA